MAREREYYKRNLTEAYLRGLNSGVDIQTMDTCVRGFHIRYSAKSKNIIFYLYYRMRATKKQNNVKIGQYGFISLKDARIAANDFKKIVSIGRDPVTEKR